MLDTYFDRADNMNRTNWLQPQRDEARRRLSEDPRYYNGHLYATVIDRNVAEARETIRLRIATDHRLHTIELHKKVLLGDKFSWFNTDGSRK